MTHQLEHVIEALLFTADAPLSLNQLQSVFDGISEEAIREAIGNLNQTYASHAFEIQEIGEGYRLLTKPDFAEWIEKMYGKVRKIRFTPATLETLAIIAYKQPISRVEVAQIRGVDSSSIIRRLLELNLIEIRGKSDDVGHPTLYGTTPLFLEHFGLRDVAELPSLNELEELLKEEDAAREKLRLGSLFERKAS